MKAAIYLHPGTAEVLRAEFSVRPANSGPGLRRLIKQRLLDEAPETGGA
ncbi:MULTISPECIES: hypothetical protein [unclassified Pseudofrankia]|nr:MULTISPECIES: hypothetical protein [unclassified Pseudofrankia]MDT3446717.1 hypothetical protein [Pseudofrankia sp. BMG5.37]